MGSRPRDAPADGSSGYPRLSRDGGRVMFQSNAANLVPDDNNGALDVFVAELPDGPIVLASRNSAGEPHRPTDNGCQGGCGYPALSADGRYVLFTSDADNLGHPSQGMRQVYRKDLETGEVQLISATRAGRPANGHSWNTETAISGDGRYVVFQSIASDLVGDPLPMCEVPLFGVPFGTCQQTYLYDVLEQTTRLISGPAPHGSFTGMISADGSCVAFWTDTSIEVRARTDLRQLRFLPVADTLLVSVSPDCAYVTIGSEGSSTIVRSSDGATARLTSPMPNVGGGAVSADGSVVFTGWTTPDFAGAQVFATHVDHLRFEHGPEPKRSNTAIPTAGLPFAVLALALASGAQRRRFSRR